MQDAIAIAVAAATGMWLVWSLTRRCLAPPCRPPAAPAGSDGFVPLDQLKGRRPGGSAHESGRPEGRPDR
ncbi:MAG: hypothetical protein RLZZ440_933 [Planctomycetota bacterium]|jgi:hypothetical protein